MDVQRLLATAERLVAYECAVLGCVTYAANHHKSAVIGRDGSIRHVTIRDVAALRRPPRLVPPPIVKPLGDAHPGISAGLDATAVQPAVRHSHRAVRPARHKARAVAARAASQARAVADAAAGHATRVAVAGTQLSSAPPAADRLAALRARILAKGSVVNAEPCFDYFVIN